MKNEYYIIDYEGSEHYNICIIKRFGDCNILHKILYVNFQLLNLLSKNIWNTYISVASDIEKSFIQVIGGATVVSTMMENM